MEQDKTTTKEEEDADRKSILFGALISLFFAPITFRVTRFIEQDSFKSDLFASILTLIFSGVLIFFINNYLKQRCHHSPSRQHNKSQLKSTRSTLFGIFSSNSVFSNDSNNLKDNNGEKQQDEHENSFRRKIDSKYFRPKFIIHELASFWGTTCTVITWGSFYVIGGTIVATEKLARKIRTKCNRDQQNNNLHNSSRGTGRCDSFASYASSNESTTETKNKDPLGRVSAWTKRSFTSIKKRFTKFVGTNMPQITASVATLGGRSESRVHSD